MDPLGDSPVRDGPHNALAGGSSHSIICLAHVAAGCMRAGMGLQKALSAQVLGECTRPVMVPSLVALAGQESPCLAEPESAS